MKYVISKNIIPKRYENIIKPDTKYEVTQIFHKYKLKRVYPKTNPIEDIYHIIIGYMAIDNTIFKSTRELNLEKILKK